MPQVPTPSRRDAIRSIARAGLAGAVLPALLAGCGTAAKRRVDAKGGKLGEPIPEDPMLIRRPWTPADDVGVARAPGAAPMIGTVQRSQWTRSAPIVALARPMVGIRRITVHHDAIGPLNGASTAEVAQRLESIRRGHVQRGWADIGYHYAVDPAGRVWQARPMSLQGAHVGEQNEHNLGIVLLGNFERQSPTGPALEALDRLIASEMRRSRVPLHEIRTHREMAPTACPGRHLQREMDRTRSRGGRLASLAQGDYRG